MRPRPCSPGGYERRSIAHFSVRQRSPLRKSFIPSRRHCLHFGERIHRPFTNPTPPPPNTPTPLSSLLPPPLLLLADAGVRLRRDVADTEDLEAGGLQRADRGLAAGAGPLDEDLDLLE